MRVGLVACAAQKLDHPAPARDLYISPLFRKAAAYCEKEYDEWYILSARLGLLDPETVVAPYNVTLNTMPRDERLRWGELLQRQLSERGLIDADLYLHAGARYRESFAGMPNAHAPLAGLGIGQQLRWYTERGC
jgi:hypothetical protein